MDIKTKLDKYFQKIQHKKPDHVTQALIWSEKNKINYHYSDDNYNQPFHIASIGKTMTAALIGIFADKGLIDINEKICSYLPDEVTEKLFVYGGFDYGYEVTVRQLLSHTSGIADYFDSKTNAGSSFVDQIMNTPDKLWTAYDLVDFTRNNQTTKSAPGHFLYSDTGYVLLGLIIENVAKMPFHEALEAYIFKPLSMNDSYLLFGGQPVNPKRQIAPIWFNGKEISKFNMLSCDWAGGGVVSTLSDLLIFQRSLWGGKLVSGVFLSEMTKINNKFRSGMHYGSGLMELHFEGFFFLLRGLPRPMGHSGILGTLMFYDDVNDLHTIINLGSNKRVVDSFKAIIYVQQLIIRFVASRKN
jgi:D-alanyl-D-alanine carboxypeptidase